MPKPSVPARPWVLAAIAAGAIGVGAGAWSLADDAPASKEAPVQPATATTSAPARARPPIDLAAPKTIHTATFALG